MTITETTLEGCFILEPKIIHDERGYFMESFNEKTFQNKVGANVHFVQDNQSFSSKGVLRGLHYQTGEHAQAKLVRVIQGEVLDVAVDIRPDSSTYGQYVTEILSAENNKQFFIPKGFAHGFLVLSETAIVFYKCDHLYNAASEGGIAYNDAQININWNLGSLPLLISEKDQQLPSFRESKKIW